LITTDAAAAPGGPATIDLPTAPAIRAEAAADLRRQAALVDHNTQVGFRTVAESSLLGQRDAATRHAAIVILLNYAELVNAVASNQSTEVISNKSMTLKQSLLSLKTESAANTAAAATVAGTADLSPRSSAILSPQQVNDVTRGLDTAMQSLTRRKTRKQLMPLIQKADPALQKLCTWLEADLTDITIQVASDEQLATMQHPNGGLKTEPKAISAGDGLFKSVSLGNVATAPRENIPPTSFSLRSIQQTSSALKRLAAEHRQMSEADKL
jgi:hypothetical protein